MKKYQEDLEVIWNEVLAKQPLALARYADGEVLFIQGKSAQGIDGWTSPSGISEIGKDLVVSLKHQERNYYYGISCDCCDSNAKEFLLSHIPQDFNQVTFSNLFANANFANFADKIQSLDEPVILVGNETINPDTIDIVDIKEFVPVGANCTEFWQSNRDEFLCQLPHLAARHHNALFLFCAGPLSGIIIDHLWRLNPSNRYLDIGSALDPWIHKKVTRPYQVSGSADSQKSCVLTDSRSPAQAASAPLDSPTASVPPSVKEEQQGYSDLPIPGAITAIINGYKRPENISPIYNAIQNQTIKPQETMVWYNEYSPDQGNLDIIRHCKSSLSNYNFGVWARFAYALNAKTEYVCIFDDDTVPGPRWFENCLKTIQSHEGLLGTVGLIFEGTEIYMDHVRYGWPNPNESIMEVDIVGHAWFFKREWLLTFWNEFPPVKGFDYMGEDMHFSYALQKYLGLKTFVPPHPAHDTSLWGSLKGQLGIDDVAISMTGKASRMDIAFNRLRHKGWQLIKERQSALSPPSPSVAANLTSQGLGNDAFIF
ncbi:MAG: hypothetical protein ACFCA4_02070 [Cyanophyceae cyanobacterium]